MRNELKKASGVKDLKRVLPKIKELKNTLSNKNAVGAGQQQSVTLQQQTLTMCGTCY
jgi:hypothetical protein